MIKKFLKKTIIISTFLFLVLPPKSIAITDPTTYSSGGGTPGTISGGVVTAALGCSGAYDAIGGIVSGLFDKGKEKVAEAIGLSPAVPTKDEVVGDKAKAQENKEKCLDSIAYAAAKVTLQVMTQNIVNWISTGFEGDSLFIKNPESFFKSLADQEVYSFVTELNNPDKYPWGPEIGEMLASGYDGEGFEETSIFNLDDEIGEDWEDFFDDFDVGGWDGWLAATQNTANNPVSFKIEASKELNNRIDDRLNEVSEELSWGNGFLSVKKCVEYESPLTVGSYSGLSSFASDAASIEEDYTLGGLSIDNCKRYEITTPGNAISEQLNITLGSGIRQAELSDELNESIASIVDALTNQLIYEGVTALQTASVDTEQTGGYGTNSGFYDGVFDTASSFVWDPYAPVDLEIVVPQNIAQLNSYVEKLTQTKDFISSEVLPTLKTIDSLMPEPDYGWEERMVEVYNEKVSEIYAESDYERFQNGLDTFFNVITLGILSPILEIDDAQFAQRKAEAAAALKETFDRESQRIPWDILNHNLPSASLFREQRDKIGTFTELLSAYQSSVSEMSAILGKLNYIMENLCDEAVTGCDNTNLQYVYATIVPYLPDEEAITNATADYESFQVEKNYASSLIPTLNNELTLSPFGGIIEPPIEALLAINASWGLTPPIAMPLSSYNITWDQKKALDYASSVIGSSGGSGDDFASYVVLGSTNPLFYIYSGALYPTLESANYAYSSNMLIVSANIVSPIQNPYSVFYPLPNPPMNPFSVYQILEGEESVCADYDCTSGLGQELYSNLSPLAKAVYEESGSMDPEDDEVRNLQINPFKEAYVNPSYIY